MGENVLINPMSPALILITRAVFSHRPFLLLFCTIEMVKDANSLSATVEMTKKFNSNFFPYFDRGLMTDHKSWANLVEFDN